MSKTTTVEHISLLWPDDSYKSNNCFIISENDNIIEDLSLEYITKALSIDNRHKIDVPFLSSLITDDPKVIKYRQEIIDDLLKYPELVESFTSLLPMLIDLDDFKTTKGADNDQLLIAVKRLGELDLYIKCIHQFKAMFKGLEQKINSEGLSKFCHMIKVISENRTFLELEEKLPKLRNGFEGLASVTVGINLDAQLRPVEATLLSINSKRFTGEPFIKKLFGKSGKNEFEGIGELHSLDDTVLRWDSRSPQVSGIGVLANKNSYLRGKDTINSIALTKTLFNDLHVVINNIIKPISSEIAHFTRINASLLTRLEPEIAFYLGALNLIGQMRSCGLDMCKPEYVSKEDRVFIVEGIYNINLALIMHYKQPYAYLTSMIVTNNVDFSKNGRIFILTGPNRGGKTTYTQCIGLTQILFQLGMFIPASKARISPVDMICTHFPVEEKPDSNLGRLGEESKRLSEIFKKATRYSLVLLNESLSSTSPGESLYIAKEIVAALKLLGVRAIFATHLHDLALNLDSFNKNIPGDSKVLSIVSGVDMGETGNNSKDSAMRTYKIIPGPPLGKSYARDIATRYGISFEKLVNTLKERDLVSNDIDIGEYTRKISKN
jgi:DNA mismatch repair ATPase MutS